MVHSYAMDGEGQEQLKEMSDMDKDYRWFVLTHLSEAEKFNSLKRKRETPNSVGKESERTSVNDPQYELFLSRLKLNGKSYMLEVEKNGVPMVIKYGESGSSDDVCVSKLQNKTKDFNVLANEKPSLGNNWETMNQVELQVKSRTGKKAQRQHNLQERSRHDIQTRGVKKHKVPTLRNLRSNVKFDSGDNCGEDVQAANKKDGGENKKKKDDDSASDLEVLETAEFCNEGNYVSILPSNKLDKSMNEDDFQILGVHSKFRKKVINIMRKPYNRAEYDELRQAVKAQRTEERNGVCTRTKKLCGKSYLNYYPDLHRKLKKFENDRRSNLKTLRGFFFWLEHKSMEGSFKPWNDPECCAVEQEHCKPPSPPAPHSQGRGKEAISSEPGKHHESVAVEKELLAFPS
ncbi:unnamed protein product [Fraxinus pennsylvanica]|uniref:Uncharacterized protein n=1 Tax=Fraxinus pennsylvanica TaxID=56036 RepID=A0AAD2DU36_9LAMI|nr:unnamed protein product [Fraxinus pennsylvanica]